MHFSFNSSAKVGLRPRARTRNKVMSLELRRGLGSYFVSFMIYRRTDWKPCYFFQGALGYCGRSMTTCNPYAPV